MVKEDFFPIFLGVVTETHPKEDPHRHSDQDPHNNSRDHNNNNNLDSLNPSQLILDSPHPKKPLEDQPLNLGLNQFQGLKNLKQLLSQTTLAQFQLQATPNSIVL
jgi:hypothetical protein